MSAPLRFSFGANIWQHTRLASERWFGTSQGPALIRATPCLLANPMMKRKKKVDQVVLQQKEIKTKRRLERAIKKLEAKGLKLKPIEEFKFQRKYADSLETRQRESQAVTFEQMEDRALLLKTWSSYKITQKREEMCVLRTAMQTQETALAALREESEELYQQAIQIDPELMPFHHKGTTKTPPLAQHEPPDGEYTETTKTYDKTVGHVDVNKLRI